MLYLTLCRELLPKKKIYQGTNKAKRLYKIEF